MSLVLASKNPVVRWPVVIPVPTDGGDIVNHEIQMDFEVIPLDELANAAPDAGLDLETAARDATERFMLDVVKGWDGVEDENGDPIQFTDEALKRLFRLPYAQVAIVRAYLDCIQGRKAKN